MKIYEFFLYFNIYEFILFNILYLFYLFYLFIVLNNNDYLFLSLDYFDFLELFLLDNDNLYELSTFYKYLLPDGYCNFLFYNDYNLNFI